MYKVIGKTQTRAFRVLWALEEMGVAYTQVAAGPGSDEAKAFNPSGKIPALEVDGTVLTDSVAIMSYLADVEGQLTFPAGTVERAQLDALLHRLNDEFDAPLWAAIKHERILPEDLRVPAILPALKWDFQRSIDRLEADFKGPFLMGETMTIADILAVHCLNGAHGMKFPVGDTLKAYTKSLRSRDAFLRAAAR